MQLLYAARSSKPTLLVFLPVTRIGFSPTVPCLSFHLACLLSSICHAVQFYPFSVCNVSLLWNLVAFNQLEYFYFWVHTYFRCTFQRVAFILWLNLYYLYTYLTFFPQCILIVLLLCLLLTLLPPINLLPSPIFELNELLNFRRFHNC